MQSRAKPQVRILLVDDHASVRYGMRQIIETAPELSVCAEADSRESALQAIRTSSADLAIVDLSLGPDNGLQVIRDMRKGDALLPMLVLSMHDDVLYAVQALHSGARGFLPKQQASAHLVHAIREVVAGRLYVSQHAIQEILTRIARSPVPW